MVQAVSVLMVANVFKWRLDIFLFEVLKHFHPALRELHILAEKNKTKQR